MITKKDVIAIAAIWGCTTAYSGNNRTMYIKGKQAQDCKETIQNVIVQRYSKECRLSPPFALVVNADIETTM